MRQYPQKFAQTVLTNYCKQPGNTFLQNDQYYFQSLQKELLNLNPQLLLYADKQCFVSAECHAKRSGATGYLGHDRLSADCQTKEHFMGECCDYGNEEPLEIVLALLIDRDVPSLGHRHILLGYYNQVGVSIQPHIKHKTNAVIDLYY